MIEQLLEGKTAKERANLKGQEIAKIVSVPQQNVKFSGADYDVEITSINDIEGGVEVFARAWDTQGQIGFGKDGTVDLERFRFFNPPILVHDPNGDIIRQEMFDGRLITWKLREDPKEALLQNLAHTIKVSTKDNPRGKVIAGKVGNTTSTFFPAAGQASPVDGAAARDSAINEIFSTIRSSAGTSAYPSEVSLYVCLLRATTTTDQYSIMYRDAFGFDTSTIPDTDDITAATISFAASGAAESTGLGDTTMEITSVTLGSASDLVAGDYAVANWGGTSFASFTISTWVQTAETYNDITLNAAGRANISKTGNTFFGTRNAWDFDNSFTGTWSSAAETGMVARMADAVGTTSDPKLVVTHSAATANHWLLMGV